MEIKVKKIEDLMTSNLMDIISGSYKFKKMKRKNNLYTRMNGTNLFKNIMKYFNLY